MGLKVVPRDETTIDPRGYEALRYLSKVGLEAAAKPDELRYSLAEPPDAGEAGSFQEEDF